MKQSSKTIALWLVLIGFFVGYYYVFSVPPGPDSSWEAVTEAAEQGQVSFVDVAVGGDAVAHFRDGRRVVVRTPNVSMLASLEGRGANIVYGPPPVSISSAIVAWLPFLAVCVLWWWMMRSIKKKTAEPNDWDVRTFEVPSRNVSVSPELNGLDDAKAILQRALEVGPRVLLLTGTHASGKSALIEWLAAQSKRPLFQKSAAEFVHMFVGVGAARVKKFMTAAAASAPCIVAVEDIEAIAMKREQFTQTETDKQSKVDEYSQTMFQLKDLIDGAKLPANVVFIATTSHPDWLNAEFVARFTRIDLPKRG